MTKTSKKTPEKTTVEAVATDTAAEIKTETIVEGTTEEVKSEGNATEAPKKEEKKKGKKDKKNKDRFKKEQPKKEKKEKEKKEPPENKIRMMFNSPVLYEEATSLAGDGKKAGYQRLEFLGDRVVGLVVAEMLHKNFPKENEGELAKRFVALVCATTLAKITTTWNLPEFKGKEHKQMRHNKSVLSDICESVIGALYLDQGLKAVQEFMLPIWTPIMLSYQHAPQDSKSALQEYSQKTYGALPKYTLLSQKGQSHMPEFTVKVEVGPYTQEAKGQAIKKAEQEAAYLVLQQIHAALAAQEEQEEK